MTPALAEGFNDMTPRKLDKNVQDFRCVSQL